MKSAKAQASLDSIAIIGMSGRFPGARNIAQFWRNLCAGIESISFFSDQELESAGLDPAALTDPSYVRAGGVVDDIDLFDAFFFALSPREAESMDPQQRVFLECAWEALEDAGCDPEQYPGLIGVYAGAATSTYLLNLQSNRALFETMGGMQIAIGNDRDHLTTHVSYKLNLKGPSVDVQTACSTSLVATCLACQSLLAHQCDVALAGGVSIKVPQKVGYLYQQGSIMSPDGHCRAFDANAQGIVGGNGLGVVVLKRLVEALEDGDSIYAVIKGSATNNDGSLKVAYTAPSLDGQAEVIAMAQAAADVDPETITYVEAHGTGTPMGDPIEIAALTQAFRARTRRTNFCAIGSVKTNIGHLDPAAGVAGLVKTVLAVKHALLPPSLHFSQPNPEIKFEDSPFYVNASLANWNTTGPRRAAVSSFGIGGTNAHVILEEAPTIEESDPSRPWQLLLLSARTDSALLDATTNLMRYLQESQNVNLADVAYTYQVGRRAFEHRTMLVCRDRQDALDALEGLDPARMLSSVNEFRDRPVVFMFPGQGAQYPAMARELYEFEATFREHVDLCTEILRPHLGFDLCRVLYSRGEDLSEGRRSLDRTSLTQPALFVIEYALAKLWMEWGVRPRAMIGHSLGEYVAACLAGVLSLEDALAVLAARGRLMEAVPAGAMLSVPLGEQEVQPLLHGPLCLAATNGPSLSVISGPSDAVRELEARLSQAGLVCRQLSTNRAFHSSMMDPVLRPFMDQVSAVRLNSPQIPYLSNVTGTWITSDAAMDPSYWTSQLRQTVRFAEGVSQLVREPGWILLEVGPGQTLGGLARQHSDRSPEQVVLSSLPYGAGHEPESAFLLNTVGRLWLSGVRLDWDGVHAHERRLRVPLPTYPFERQR
ncbi:MAG: type I polyketide synthase, partial [Candidatus Sulfotelmatobacter sp.]